MLLQPLSGRGLKLAFSIKKFRMCFIQLSNMGLEDFVADASRLGHVLRAFDLADLDRHLGILKKAGQAAC